MTDYFGEGENNWQMVGLKVFFKIWGWLIGPLVFFLFLGKFLESRFSQWAPWPFVICMDFRIKPKALSQLLEKEMSCEEGDYDLVSCAGAANDLLGQEAEKNFEKIKI